MRLFLGLAVLSLSASIVKAGFVLSEKLPAGQCGPNSEYLTCGTACPKTCENVLSPTGYGFCTDNCVAGCFCLEGYVLDAATNSCVLPSQCGQPTCGENEVYTTCGSSCPANCKEYFTQNATACNFSCFIGCVCQEGYIRNHENKCVKPKQCKQKCECQYN
ncbi:serine protease inhibitor swm-1-like isoform X1 [Uranotaenia lowii]|uniref:serine protease inhibitor swm-1-like isoform X1 n=1 Tax=Uranotaenia lowii TaxID=190385 RepID=UPI00247AB1A4|nr:serine protease inhibitor swm-1-like isoform X1 [Uranotaenia lowii]